MYRATEDIYFGAHSGGALTRALFCIVELQGPLEDARYGNKHSGPWLLMCDVVHVKRVSPAHRLLYVPALLALL